MRKIDTEFETNLIYDLAKTRDNAWDIIDAARTKGVKEESTRRAIWRLLAEKRLKLSSDRKLSQTSCSC